MLAHFREDDALYGSRRHAFLELAWTTGARQGGLRALDLQDLYISERYIEFRHRPDTGTPLKNKRGGERPVGLKQESVDALKHYIRNDRVDKADDHGRQPLLTTIQGRLLQCRPDLELSRDTALPADGLSTREQSRDLRLDGLRQV